MGIASDLSDIKDVSDTIVANKVSKFCYTDTAYEDNDANGVSTYDVNQEQNIPTSDPSIMKVNETVVTKGWRTRASSITRMFMNHMLGRLSYNVNKLTDMMSSLLTALNASLDTANGLATVNSSGKVSLLDNVVNTGDSDTPSENGTDKFTTGGAFTELAKKAPVNHASETTDYGHATSSKYGHVMLHGGIETKIDTQIISILRNQNLCINYFTTAGNFGYSNGSDSFTLKMVILTNGQAPTVQTVQSSAHGPSGMTYQAVTFAVPANTMVIAFREDMVGNTVS